MNKVNFSVWDNEVAKNVKEIYRVTDQIKNIDKRLKTNGVTYDTFQALCINICETLNFWTGHTYVGRRKQPQVQKAFQAFFEALYAFLFICRDLDNSTLQDLANKSLYRGVLYRYLGHDSLGDNIDSKVEPEYNNIYVSWSKKPQHHYIESKLYGTMTLLTCEVREPHYGIDLNVFGVVRGAEVEVVFPTFADAIKNIEYIS